MPSEVERISLPRQGVLLVPDTTAIVKAVSLGVVESAFLPGE